MKTVRTAMAALLIFLVANKITEAVTEAVINHDNIKVEEKSVCVIIFLTASKKPFANHCL